MVSKPVKTSIPIAGVEMQIKIIIPIRWAKIISSVDEASILPVNNVTIFTN